jgi:hypothetical protein
MKNVFLPFLLFFGLISNGQSIGIESGIMNYEGDLKPNSFTFSGSLPFASVFFKRPFNNHIAWRSGFSMGKIQAADKNNRADLQSRNLQFASSITELYTGLEWDILNIEATRVSPYLFAGVAGFHFNPYGADEQGNKTYLKPLSTEGQGLAAYPDRKPYKLNQAALTYAAGLHLRLSDYTTFGIELAQRKTFTDYLDDVSSTYVSYDALFQAKGQKAVDLAYRGDELSNTGPYPQNLEQRGTPLQKDWYYFLGLSLDVKMDGLRSSLSGIRPKRNNAATRCPKVF